MDLLSKIFGDPLTATLSAIALILTCIALYMLRKQNINGWLVFIPSYILQIVIFWITQNWFLLVQMIVLAILSLSNFFEWRKNESPKD